MKIFRRRKIGRSKELDWAWQLCYFWDLSKMAQLNNLASVYLVSILKGVSLSLVFCSFVKSLRWTLFLMGLMGWLAAAKHFVTLSFPLLGRYDLDLYWWMFGFMALLFHHYYSPVILDGYFVFGAMCVVNLHGRLIQNPYARHIGFLLIKIVNG
jgi:hypothetical protein